jgi:RNase H-like domain found in reverse transcriptase
MKPEEGGSLDLKRTPDPSHGRPFTVFTDHESLKCLQMQDCLSPRQVQWMEHLIEFDFQITYIKGRTKVVADALSRTPNNAPSPEQQNREILDKLISKTTTVALNAISQLKISTEDLRNLQTKYSSDPEFTELLKALVQSYHTHSAMGYYFVTIASAFPMVPLA